jgi:hypothetical protein
MTNVKTAMSSDLGGIRKIIPFVLSPGEIPQNNKKTSVTMTLGRRRESYS